MINANDTLPSLTVLIYLYSDLIRCRNRCHLSRQVSTEDGTSERSILQSEQQSHCKIADEHICYQNTKYDNSSCNLSVVDKSVFKVRKHRPTFYFKTPLQRSQEYNQEFLFQR